MSPNPIPKLGTTTATWLLTALLLLLVAITLGCALATPFQPNANAANTATNTANACPTVSVGPQTVSVPDTQPAPP